jgi:hypothetical protein
MNLGDDEFVALRSKVFKGQLDNSPAFQRREFEPEASPEGTAETLRE